LTGTFDHRAAAIVDFAGKIVATDKLVVVEKLSSDHSTFPTMQA